MNKIKVIQIIDTLNVGGAEFLAVNTANGLHDKEITSHFCVTRYEGELYKNLDKNIPYLFLNRKHTIDFNAIIKLVKYCKKNQINIIHSHTNSFFIAVLVKLFLWKVKIFWHNHTGANINLKGKKFFVIKWCSLFFNTAIHVDKKLNQWGKLNLFVKNNIYIPNFSVLSNKEEKTKLKGIPEKRIICLAGLREEKNHLNLLKAFRKVIDKHNDWSLHLIGKDYKDKYSRSIHHFIYENKLEDKVFIYGVCKDISYILSQGDIGVLSSDSEGLPLSLLEYGLAKLPVVVTNVGECAYIVENNVSGLTIPRRDDAALSMAILKLIENDNKKILGVNLFNHVQNNYSKENNLKQLINIYSTAIC